MHTYSYIDFDIPYWPVHSSVSQGRALQHNNDYLMVTMCQMVVQLSPYHYVPLIGPREASLARAFRSLAE